MVEIYADVVFFINFAMDFFVFWIVSKLIRQKAKLYRLLLGGAVAAALYCFVIFFPRLEGVLNIFLAFAILMLGTIISFGITTVKEFIKLIFFAHLTAFALGGAGMALFYYSNISDYIGNFIGFTVHNFSIKLLIAVSCAAYIMIKLASGWISRTIIKKQIFYHINIVFDNTEISLNALVDTGNSLHDPISNFPVIVVEFAEIKQFLPDSLKIMFYEKQDDDLFSAVSSLQESRLAGRIRMIPFTSIGKQNGMLLGFKPDKVIIAEKKLELQDVIIAIHNFRLSKDGVYHALINPDIFA